MDLNELVENKRKAEAEYWQSSVELTNLEKAVALQKAEVLKRQKIWLESQQKLNSFRRRIQKGA